jgi:hypothetical protein
MTYIRAWCREQPKLEWLLITNLPVEKRFLALSCALRRFYRAQIGWGTWMANDLGGLYAISRYVMVG